MQTLTFNTTFKKVVLLSGSREDSKVLEVFDNVSTVRCSELGFYEIMQKLETDSISAIPVMRLPITSTNMIIIK
jgi:hypothetical protein